MTVRDRFITVLCAFLAISGGIGCARTAAYTQCTSWKMSGEMFSSMRACQQCVEQNGPNLEVVRGCAVGVDAADFITAISPGTASTN